MEVNEVSKSAKKKFLSFLADKPIWASWAAYTLVSSILFVIFYAAMSLMVLQWWIPIVIVIGVGMIWGTLNFEGKTSS